jgi:hypothetical protein
VFEIDSKTDVGSKKRKYGSFSYISSLSWQ